MKNQLTLLHFDSAEDLLDGTGALQQHNIAIREIYSAAPIPGVETKLRLKQRRLGDAALRYGCLIGITLVSLAYYGWQPQPDWKAGWLDVLILLFTCLVAGRLFPAGAPKLLKLKPGDGRYLMIVDAPKVPVDEVITHLFQYTAAVEISPAIKHMVIS